MKLSELILAVGDENVGLQNLDTCITTIDMNKRGTKITFGTEQAVNMEGPVKLGMVVWLDRDKVAAAMAKGNPNSA